MRHRAKSRGAWRRTHALETLRARAEDPAQTPDWIRPEPRDELCRMCGQTNEKLGQPRTQILDRGPQVVDQRTHLINERIRPRTRALQERTRRLGEDAQPRDERTHVFCELRCDLPEWRRI